MLSQHRPIRTSSTEKWLTIRNSKSSQMTGPCSTLDKAEVMRIFPTQMQSKSLQDAPVEMNIFQFLQGSQLGSVIKAFRKPKGMRQAPKLDFNN